MTIHTIQEPTGRGGARRRGRLRLLETFDANAQPYVADIKAVLGANAEPIVSQIEASTEKRPMISLEEAKQVGNASEQRGRMGTHNIRRPALVEK